MQIPKSLKAKIKSKELELLKCAKSLVFVRIIAKKKFHLSTTNFRLDDIIIFIIIIIIIKQ